MRGVEWMREMVVVSGEDVYSYGAQLAHRYCCRGSCLDAGGRVDEGDGGDILASDTPLFFFHIRKWLFPINCSGWYERLQGVNFHRGSGSLASGTFWEIIEGSYRLGGEVQG
jgi:hypothetical protein